MSRPRVAAIVGGQNNYATAYVVFKDVVDVDGALLGTPTLTDVDDTLTTSTEASLAYSGTVKNVAYSAGEVLTFEVENLSATDTTAYVDIEYQTPLREETLRVAIELKEFET